MFRVCKAYWQKLHEVPSCSLGYQSLESSQNQYIPYFVKVFHVLSKLWDVSSFGVLPYQSLTRSVIGYPSIKELGLV